MKKSLLHFVLGGLCLFATAQVKAQAIAYVGPRLLITTQTPSALEGTKDFTWSSDPAITGPWGRVIDSIWNAVPLEMVSLTDSIACEVAAFPAGSLTGKWALIWRGDCEFGSKSKKAQDAGAVGVIIVNQFAGAGPVNMAAGQDGGQVTIPVLMVSNPDGIALDAMVHSANQVYVTLTPYGFNNAHDLCIPNELVALAPGFAIPKDQLDTATNGKPKAYQGYMGGWVANTGTSNETNVKLNLNVNWTPTAGSPTLFYKDSVTIPTLNALDSLDVVNSTTSKFNLHATTTGQFDFTYTASAALADGQPLDNTQKFTMYATNAAFCRSHYNNQAGEPLVTGGLRVGGATPPLNMTWGPLFYVAKPATAYNMQLALYPDDTTQHDLSFIENSPGLFFTAIFKWVDANSDQVIDGTELTLVGTGNHTFSAFDLPGKPFVAPFDANVTLEANTWYWATAVMSNTELFLGVDQNANYFNRIFASDHLATGAWKDYWAPLYEDGITDQPPYLNAADTVGMIPFVANKALNYMPTDSMAISLGENTPSIALNTQFLASGVDKKSIKENSFTVFPNPTTENINVSVDFPTAVSNVTFSVMNAMGQVIATQNKGTIKNSSFSLPTKGLPSGNYYIIMNADGRTTFRSITVNTK